MSELPIDAGHPYQIAVKNALFAFQMLEEGLKICIGLSYEIIRSSVPEPINFNFDASSITSAPLSKLVKLFSGITANRALVSDLRKIEKWRNFCAHEAYVHEFMSRHSGTPVTVKDVQDVEIVATFTVNLVQEVGNEIQSLRKVRSAHFKGLEKRITRPAIPQP